MIKKKIQWTERNIPAFYLESVPFCVAATGCFLSWSKEGTTRLKRWTSRLDVELEQVICLKDFSILQETINPLESYFLQSLTKFSLPINLLGSTNFQKRIYKHMLDHVPYRTRITYGELAVQVGHDKAYRAVASAQAKNPVPIIVPCHRVVCKSHIGEYSGCGGRESKGMLQRLEGT